MYCVRDLTLSDQTIRQGGNESRFSPGRGPGVSILGSDRKEVDVGGVPPLVMFFGFHVRIYGEEVDLV